MAVADIRKGMRTGRVSRYGVNSRVARGMDPTAPIIPRTTAKPVGAPKPPKASPTLGITAATPSPTSALGTPPYSPVAPVGGTASQAAIQNLIQLMQATSLQANANALEAGVEGKGKGTSKPFTGAIDATADRKKFATAILKQLGAPISDNTLNFMLAWMQAEGTDAAYNPLATTQSMAGARDFNSVGVKNYPSFNIGLRATIKTLTNGRYNQIINLLKQNANPMDIASSKALATWGTGGLVKSVLKGSR